MHMSLVKLASLSMALRAFIDSRLDEILRHAVETTELS
jgi:hypothetical protein